MLALPHSADCPDHGTRARYQAGCRCLPCRGANASYAQQHTATAWTSADAARAHLQGLMPAIGVRQAAQLSGLSISHVQRIRNGQQQRVKLTTEAAVLAIQSRPAKGQRINGYRTRDYVYRLVREGYTRARLARLLGLKGRGLRYRQPTVTLKTAGRIRALFRYLTAEDCAPSVTA